MKVDILEALQAIMLSTYRVAKTPVLKSAEIAIEFLHLTLEREEKKQVALMLEGVIFALDRDAEAQKEFYTIVRDAIGG